MQLIYNLIIQIIAWLLPLLALINPKMKLFVQGRKDVFDTLKEKITDQNQMIWFHVASLGEYEQGLPIMTAIKEKYPNHKLLLTFFSPSGFEVRKNNIVADITLYLPLDTPQNAKRFIQLAHPKMVFFVKYEFWLNFLAELKKQNIETYLISGVFRKNQLFFKSYGGFYKKALTPFKHFFVQNETSANLLRQIGFENVTVSGDTRFDRVADLLKQKHQLDFINTFKGNALLIVAGSTWAKDEDLLVDFINQTTFQVKLIIAPHNINPNDIQQLNNKIKKPTVLYSQQTHDQLNTAQVLILDTIGLLTKVYSYANIAYVGGGFGQPGVHNVLEPAVFGMPIIIGPNFIRFIEATSLVNKGGCIVINNVDELQNIFNKLIEDDVYCLKIGRVSESFVKHNTGATAHVMKYLAI